MSIFFVSFFVCVVLIFLLRKLARGWGMLDHPDERKQHTHPTPTVGGIAMFFAVVLAVNFGLALPYPQKILLGCSAALVALGVFDDKHNLAVNLRLMIQVTLALIVIVGAQGSVTYLGSVFGMPINLGLLTVPLSLIAFVGGINAMNMIDGADGMAGSMALITMIGVAVLCSVTPLGISLTLPLALLGAIALPLARLCYSARIITNIDGIEWRREKWQGFAKWFFRFSKKIAVRFSHQVVSDNGAIALFLPKNKRYLANHRL